MKFDYKKFVKVINDRKFYEAYEMKGNFGLRKIAKETKVSPATLSRILNGKKADIDTILRICTWLKKSITNFNIVVNFR